MFDPASIIIYTCLYIHASRRSLVGLPIDPAYETRVFPALLEACYARRHELPAAVMAGLVPAIHAVEPLRRCKERSARAPLITSPGEKLHCVDGRDKPGHDGWRSQ